MKHATLRQLKVFETAARHLNFSRAAQELHLTQPAVSTQIKLLQQHAGLALFEQLGKKVYLTPAGTELLHYSRAIIELFRQAGEAMATRQGVSGGTLNVAVISAGDYFFPQLLAEFARAAPGVKLNLGVFNRQQLLQQLGDNLTDLAIMVRPPRELDTVNEPFAPHPYVIVARPDHPLAQRRRVPVSALLHEPWLTRERGSDTWNSMEDGFGAQSGQAERRDGDPLHRDDQAGGDCRHGDQLPVGPHDRPRAREAAARRARRGRLSAAVAVVRGAFAAEGAGAGGAGIQGLSARTGRAADRPGHGPSRAQFAAALTAADSVTIRFVAHQARHAMQCGARGDTAQALCVGGAAR